MMPMTRQEIEVLLDAPGERDFIVSVYADLTVQDGFHDFAARHLKNERKAVEAALSQAGDGAKKALEENLREADRLVAGRHDPSARGLAVFASTARGLRRAVELDFPVENRLV